MKTKFSRIEKQGTVQNINKEIKTKSTFFYSNLTLLCQKLIITILLYTIFLYKRLINNCINYVQHFPVESHFRTWAKNKAACLQ